MAVPEDPNARLTRDAAAALTEVGFPVATATLATKATRGGGPPFQKFGTRPLYVWRDALAWAQLRLGPVVNSTSELDAVTARSSRASRDFTQGRNRPFANPSEEHRERTVEIAELADPGVPGSGMKS